jgi:hypothetical protein
MTAGRYSTGGPLFDSLALGQAPAGSHRTFLWEEFYLEKPVNPEELISVVNDLVKPSPSQSRE